ncbi:MAG: OmpA family protein [Candidatus Thiodiazotropha sp.]
MADFSNAYVVDSSGEPVTSSSGECVKTSAWSEASPPCPAPVIYVQDMPHTFVFDIDDASFFGFDRVKLSQDAKSDLNRIVAAVKDTDLIKDITITGHADRIGPDPYNRKLAKARAEAVKRHLVAQGVSPSRIQTYSDGSSDPLVKCPGIEKRNKLIDCLAPNRRVEVKAVLADTVDIKSMAIIQPHL